MSKDNRYQFQPRHVRAYRWLRWRPWYVLIGLYWTARWLARGAPLHDRRWTPTRWSCLKQLWRINKGSAQVKMGHYVTHEELIRELKA